ncbi:MAG TPA: TonB-dependent receptor [Thermoanaerobaculaceae bacterium]|nr:TonB-dependent receptor [Thermoanaerobaculaceae bacterium]
MTKRWLIILCALAIALPALAQNPTGTLTGRASDDKGEALPGVTVSIQSPSMQGIRTAVTSVNGDYVFRFLPPGDYTVKFELQGFSTLETTKKISAAQNSTVNAEMPMTQVAEEVTVTGSFETISQTSQLATTVTYDLMNKLPVVNNMNNFAALTAGTTATGPSQAITISGAMSYENLFLVNGVAIMDNLRNTPTALYIEDAVEETTTATASVSAEYGRFSGGVVNMLTKSGGNQFSGSYRLALDNDKWLAKTPLTKYGSQADKINQTHQATLGGFILKDRLWFFAAGRYRDTKATGQTGSYTSLTFPQTTKDTRYEGKLTLAFNPNHRVIGSYIDYKVEQGNNSYPNNATILDLASLYNRELPSKLFTGNYTGVITDNFFVEAQYSKKQFKFVGSGSQYTDKINGTLLLDTSRSNARFWSPTFCGVCEPEERNNNDYILKASYFLSTSSLGTHDIVAGFDQFDDIRKQMNHQSGSDYRIYLSKSIINSTTKEVYPVFSPGSSTYFYWQPILKANKGTSFKTQSLFVNDKWRLSNNFSFNIGLRYDKNDGKDGEGKTVADDAKLSPRLGISWDPSGDGNWLVNAGYATYSTAIANSIGDSTSSAGNAATWQWNYSGPGINENCQTNGTNCIGSAAALAQFFAWFDSIGGTNNTSQYRGSPDIPGGNSKIAKTLLSPSTDELTVGVTKRLGTSGTIRVDLIHRDFRDFYVTRLDLTTGTVTTPNGTFNLRLYDNENSLLERTYNAMQTSFSYRVTQSISLGGNYTLSRLYGNFVGEDITSGPLTSDIREYPEYKRMSWYAPKGNLGQDQRHKARLWAVWDVLSTKHHTMSISLMESFFSGTPYGASGTVALRNASNQPYVTNPGYITAPTTVGYWFTNRDKWTSANITRTDLSVNYAFKIPALGTDLQFFVQPGVINLLNEQGVELVNTTVYTGNNAGRNLTRFNPITDTPVECIGAYPGGDKTKTFTCQGSGNWMKGPDFGKATATTNYQTPRTYTFSVGVRF